MPRTPTFWQHKGLCSTALQPLACLYGVLRWLDVKLHRPKTFDVPVWCVGNVTAGGAGKTPTTLALLDRLNDANTHVVLRGYKGRLQGPVRVNANEHSAADVGDEALLLAAAAPTWVARDRAAGIRAAIAAGAQRVLLDDGLQNTRIKAARNILVVDAGAGFGNGRLLPAGPLREPLAAAVRRIDAIIIIGDDALDPSVFGAVPQHRARVQADATGLDISARYVAFSGIGRPEKFFASARKAGLQIVDTISYPDHHAYSLDDWHHLLRRARTADAHLLTTTKDAVRLAPTQRAQVRQLPIALRFDDEAALATLLESWRHEA